MDDATKRKLWGRLLAVLLETPDEDAASFRMRRLGGDSQVSDERIVHTRQLLETIASALQAGDDDTWARLDHAWTLLHGPPEVPVEEQPELEIRAERDEPIAPEEVHIPSDPNGPAKPPPVQQAVELQQSDVPEHISKDIAAQSKQSPWTGSARQAAKGLKPLATAGTPYKPPVSVPATRAAEPPPPVRIETASSPLEAGKPQTLPFRGGSAAAPPPVSVVELSASGTVPLAGAGAGGGSLPFTRAAASGSDVPTLTLQQYAALRSACEVEPGRAAELYRAVGASDDATRVALDAHWSAHFQSNETEAQLFALMKQRIGSS